MTTQAKKDNLKVREEKAKGVYVEGQTEIYVTSLEEVMDVLRIGQHNRAIAETSSHFVRCVANSF